MENKEKNFISAVVYLRDDEARVEPFFTMLHRQLEEHFSFYEVVCVNDGCHDNTVEKVKAFCAAQEHMPVTIINMSIRQGLELSMNAGLDMAIGDFVYEFDSMETCFDPDLIWRAYETSLRGHDVVTVSPTQSRSLSSRLFYGLFNRFSGSAYQLQTDMFRLLSRRAINRVHAISDSLPYRKAAYAASGLKMATINFEGAAPADREGARFGRAMDSLALYTDAGYKLTMGIAAAMLLVTVAELVYTLVIYFGAFRPIEGWTTTMLVLSAGFFGVFLILAIMMKFLTLLVDLVFKQQKYLVESIEKIQK